MFARLRARFEHLVRELGKFGTVGLIAYVVDVSLFNLLLLGADVQKFAATTISMSVAATVAFVGNRHWTWKDRARTGLRREYGLYFLFNVIGLLIGLACLAISTYGLGSIWPVFTTPLADNIAKNIVGMIFGSAFRFWAYKTIVFPQERPATTAGVDGQ